MKDISGSLRRDSDPIWKKILNHPFVVELYSGTLPSEKFRFYVLQDYNYLVADMRNFGMLASKAPSVSETKEMLEIAHLEATTELSGYESLLKKLGYNIEDAVRVEPALITTAYTSFLLATSSLKTFWEALAATVPCFWTYAEIYDHNEDRLKENNNELYVEWASVYSTRSYRELVNKMIALLNKADVEYEKLKKLFVTSSRYEQMYWETMYSEQGSW